MLEKYLNKELLKCKENFIFIQGGSGKTTILREFAENSDKSILFVTHNMHWVLKDWKTIPKNVTVMSYNLDFQKEINFYSVVIIDGLRFIKDELFIPKITEHILKKNKQLIMASVPTDYKHWMYKWFAPQYRDKTIISPYLKVIELENVRLY